MCIKGAGDPNLINYSETLVLIFPKSIHAIKLLFYSIHIQQQLILFAQFRILQNNNKRSRIKNIICGFAQISGKQFIFKG